VEGVLPQWEVLQWAEGVAAGKAGVVAQLRAGRVLASRVRVHQRPRHVREPAHGCSQAINKQAPEASEQGVNATTDAESIN
jgi:hypothetical protein